MAYVEWLRVRNVLRVFSIVIGCLLLLGIALRFTPGLNPLENEIDMVKTSPTAHVSVRTLPGGITQTTIDDPNGNVHAVVSDYGYGRKGYLIGPLKPGTQSYTVSGKYQRARLQVTGSDEDNMSGQAPADSLEMVMLAAGMIVSFFLGGTLGRENEHVAIAWTKPVGRTELALRMYGVDAVAILCGMAIALAASVCAVLLFGGISFSPMTADDWQVLAFCLLGPFCWHAFVTAATASLKRYSRAIGFFGVLYLAAFIVPPFARVEFGSSAPGQAAHAVFNFLAFFDPLTYMQSLGDASSLGGRTHCIEILVALTVAYVAASLVQWRRLEA